ncbi:MAG: nucleotidyltransferase family protein [Epsilonproteobacteria bacterium]|nr:nucleotidyltransferase family protein [Campylobacterota bacterium]
MTAMILSAGLGTRMLPLTEHTPKPLLMVGGKPLIVWHIEKLKNDGINKIVINIAHLGYKIRDYLGNGERYGVDIIYSDEQDEGALETAGGIIKALDYLSDTFLVINGDVWSDYRFDKNFELKDKLAHLILVDNPIQHPNGDFSLEDTLLTKKDTNNYTFAGIGYYNKKLFQNLDYGKRALAPILFQAIDKKLLSGEYFEGEWRDIGTPQRLNELDFMLNKSCKNDIKA